MDYWKYLDRSVKWIEQHITENLDHGRIAASAGCSEFHFARIFRNHTGHSVIEYLRQRRLVHSVQELYREKPVAQIAAEYGYETPSGFSKAFRRHFDRSPSEYREMIESTRNAGVGGEMRIKSVEDENALRRVYDFGDFVLNYTSHKGYLYSWEFWCEQFERNPQFLLYAAEAEKIRGAVWGWVGDNNNVTAGLVAVASECRRKGIGAQLVSELRKRVKAGGHPTIALGAVREAEGFYLKCGFTPTLFLQSEKYSLAELRAVNTVYEESWGVESDAGGWAKLMLKTPVIDEELRRRYDELFEDCVPQTVFLMFL